MIDLINIINDSVGWLLTAKIVADFFIIAVAFYFILRAVRFTAGLTLLLSFPLIWGAYFLASSLDLKGVVFIFNKGSTVFALGIVILFQEDIRRLILKANPDAVLSKVFSRIRSAGISNKKSEELINVLVKACGELSSRRIGALIVVDRIGDLEAYTFNTVKLNADLTPELLHAIFIDTHGNPLHDGATIIDPQNNRITTAGVFLPLSINPAIEMSMGTRHRAGIGLSEEKGALVIIVSEETGKITLCDHGRFKRFAPTEDALNKFRGELQRVLSPDAVKKASERASMYGSGARLP